MNVKLIIIILISFTVLTINSGKWGVTESSEARYAEISKEMVLNNDFIHPKLLDVYHYHKPPVTYWITTLGYKLFGINEFGARFFLQVAIIIQLALVYGISLLLFNDKKLSLVAICIYFSLPIVIISSRNLTTDAYLCTFILASIFSWLRFKIKNRTIWIYLFYILLGIAFEIKGPIALVFILTFISLHKIITKEKLVISKHHIIGFLMFLFISAFWYILVAYENPKLLDYFINKQVINRVTSNSFHRGKPFWYYLAMIPLLGAPWIFILFFHYKKQNKKNISSKPKELLLISTACIIILIFSIFKTKLILYILPVFSFLAIASAKILTEASINHLKVYNRILIILITIIPFSILLISFMDIGFNFSKQYAIILLFSTFLVIALIQKTKIKTAYNKTAYLSFLFGIILIMSGNEFLSRNQSQLNSFKDVAIFINNNLNDVEKIVVYDYLIPSAAYYTNKNIITLNNGRDTVNRETQFEENFNWQDHLINIQTDIGKNQAQAILSSNAVLVTRNKNHSPEDLINLSKVFKNKKSFKNWIIFY